jgi:hypothetical protein
MRLTILSFPVYTWYSRAAFPRGICRVAYTICRASPCYSHFHHKQNNLSYWLRNSVSVTPWISFFVVRSLVQETLPAICASFYVAVLPGFTFATVAGRLSSEALLPAIIFIFLHLSNKAMSHGCLKDVAMLSLLYHVSSSLWNEYFLLLNFAAIFLFCKVRSRYFSK